MKQNVQLSTSISLSQFLTLSLCLLLSMSTFAQQAYFSTTPETSGKSVEIQDEAETMNISTTSLSLPSNLQSIQKQQKSSGSEITIDGPFCNGCDDPKGGSALGCLTGTSYIIQGIDVSSMTGSFLVNSIDFNQESFGDAPNVTVKIFCGTADTVMYSSAHTPLYTEVFTTQSSNDGKCVTFELTTPLQIEPACGTTLWIEFKTTGGKRVVATPQKCNGSTATGKLSYMRAPICNANKPKTFKSMGFKVDASFAINVTKLLNIEGAEYCASQGQTTLDAVGDWTSYSWSNGASTQTIEVVDGTYSATVTNADGLVATDEVTIVQHANPIPTFAGNLSYCEGENTTLDVGTWAEYLWSNGMTNQSITATAGKYTVTVTDSNGCTGTDNATVIENSNPTPQISNVILDNTFSLVSDATNLSGGCYRLTPNSAFKKGAIWNNTPIDLSNSFVATFQIDIGFGKVNADGITFIFHRDPRGMNTIGEGELYLGFGGLNSSGKKVIPGMAVAFRGYLSKVMEIWRNGNIGNNSGYKYNISGTGTHDIRVEWNALTKTLTADWDNDGVDITVNQDIVNTIFGGDPSNIIWGFAAATGGAKYAHKVCDIQMLEIPTNNSVEYCASDNSTVLYTGNYDSYAWSNGESTQSITATSGTYTVTVTNSNGCTGTDQVTVTENANPEPSITGNLEYCASSNNTTLDAGIWASYAWSSGESTQTINATQEPYTITVTSAEGCIGTAVVSVTENANPIPTITGNLAYCASSNNTTLDAGSWSEYLWSNGENTQVIDATAGTYTVTITDSNGCTGTDQVTVTENANPEPSITGNLAYCASSNNTTLDAGTWSAYLWSSGENTQMIDATEGSYAVTVTNSNGCTGTDQVTVTENENANVSITGNLAYCASSNNTTLDAGTWSAYLWSSGENTQMIDATEGSYAVTVTNSNGCTGTDQVTVTENENASVSITGNLEYCASSNNTTLDADSWSEYLWSNGEETQMIDATAGTYTVTVTDSNGCTGTNQVTVTENANPSPNITGNLEYCASSNNTTLDAGSWSEYLWSNGENTQTITATAGTYTVTVTDSNRCTGTDEVTVTENDNPEPNITGDLEYCKGGNTTLDAGTWSEYLWSSGEDTQMIDVTAGTYTVTITDSNGCTGTDEVSITENEAENVSITGSLEYCASDETTSLDAGTWTSYIWSNGEDTQMIDATEGTYTVTVTDSNGCISIGQVSVTENANPEPSITGDLEYCKGGNTTLDAGTWSEYLWSSGEDTQMIDATEGTYTVTITDSNGCTGTDEVTVIKNDNPEPSITGDLKYCASANTTTLDAGSWASYLWSNDEDTQTIDVGEGTYTVTVTDNSGCTGTDEVTVIKNDNPEPSITGDLEYCASDETTSLDAGTWSEYLWSNGEDTQMIDATEGTYTVTVTDNNGCIGTDEVSITENANPIPAFNNNTLNNNAIVCSEASDIKYTLKREELNSGGNYDNGFSNYADYDWSIVSGDFTNNPNKDEGKYTAIVDWSEGPATGNVFVTVTDDNGCTGNTSMEVDILLQLMPTITGTFEYCRGREATLDAGTYDLAPQSYQWSNGETSQSFSTTVTGLYTVTVTNQEGCTGTATAAISATPCLAEAGILTTNEEIICAGGSIEVNTTGEQMGDNYSQYFFLYTQDNLGTTILHESTIADYGNGTADAKFDGLEAGNYLVCAYNECQSCLPNPSPNTTDLDDIYDTGSIQDGCFDIECATITVPEAFEPNLEGSGSAPTTGTGMNIFIAEVCGGTAPYSDDFTSSGGFASVQELASENPGCINYQITYANNVDWTLTVMDSNGCSNEATVFSSDDWVGGSVLQIGEATVTKETCAGDEDGSITIEVSGGDDSCDEYTYTWSSTNGFSETNTDGATGNTIEDLASGTYNLTVTDCSGVTVTDEIYVGRANGRARGRGGCKTAGSNDFHEVASLKAYPNPFGERTMIEFSIPEASKVWLSVYSIEGRKVAEILQGKMIEENVLQRWSFEADELQAGLYILELQTESGLRQHQQLVVVK